MQGATENIDRKFENSETAEQGGIASESSKKPFFTRNVLIAIVSVIVAALVGVMIFVHVTGRSIGGGSKNGRSLISKNQSVSDRIFFGKEVLDEKGDIAYEIQSILADNTEFRTHGPFENERLLIRSNQEAKLIAYNSKVGVRSELFIQDWQLNSKKSTGIECFNPSLSADGSQIVCTALSDVGNFKFLIASKNGELLRFLDCQNSYKPSDPFFTHDGKSIIFRAAPRSNWFGEPHTLYKVNIDGNPNYEKIFTVPTYFKFLVSPHSDKILITDDKSFNLVNFSDMNNVKVRNIDYETNQDRYNSIDPLSWSSDDKFVYLCKRIDLSPDSIVELELKSGELSEIYKIPKTK